MAAIIETIECYPKPIENFGITLPAPEVDHDNCPKGQTTPGVMGGWICPCPCHRR